MSDSPASGVSGSTEGHSAVAAGSPHPTRRATLHEVAAVAGVSLKTASRALGGEAYVSEQTRKQVLDAARQLGYQRNAAASLLARGLLTDSIGLITGDFTNPFYSALAEGLEGEIRDHQMHLSVANARECPEQEWRLARYLADLQPRALVVVSAMVDHSRYAALQSRGIPVVFVDRPAAGIAADSVVLDNHAAGQLATAHLLALGHRRIAFVGDYAWLPTHRARVAGMRAALDEAMLPAPEELVRSGAHTPQEARRLTRAVLDMPQPPSAIIAGNNQVVLGVMEELAADPPAQQPALICLDEFEWARVLGISVVAREPEDLGRRAAQLALARGENRDREVEEVVLPVMLTARSSTKAR